jgi:hypothetical protein
MNSKRGTELSNCTSRTAFTRGHGRSYPIHRWDGRTYLLLISAG